MLQRCSHIACLTILVLADGAAQKRVEPNAGQWKTWVIASGGALRLAAPPDETATTAELDALRAMMAANDETSLAVINYWDSGSPAYRWIQIAAQEMQKRNVPAPLATRGMALAAAAIYDATVAAWDSKYTYNRPRPSELDRAIYPVVGNPRSPSYPSEYAATAAAASTVLTYLFPDSADHYADLAQQASRSRLLAGTELPSDSAAGLQLGQQVGTAVVARAKADGSDRVSTATFPPSPGKWGSANPVLPLAGTWTPWVLSSGSQLRPAAPPAFDSAEMSKQLAMVKDLVRTNDISHNAWFWQPSFTTPWVETIGSKIFEHHLDENAPRAARVYALSMFAQHDATIACWDTKYAYLEPRPIMFDAAVSTLFATPAHPSFPSGHACASGGIDAVLEYIFPGSDSQFFADQAAAAGKSTFDAGIHFPIDVEGGLALGRNVGQAVVAAAQTDGSQRQSR